MQADTRIKPQTETENLFALDRPSLGNLSYALRHPDSWPEAFEWDYTSCSHCAMGLAHQLWEAVPAGSPNRNVGASRMARAFHIPFQAASSIFYGGVGWVPTKQVKSGIWPFRTTEIRTDTQAISPEMVADQIDKYLAEAK